MFDKNEGGWVENLGEILVKKKTTHEEDSIQDSDALSASLLDLG
jgi:hypothetical protein